MSHLTVAFVAVRSWSRNDAGSAALAPDAHGFELFCCPDTTAAGARRRASGGGASAGTEYAAQSLAIAEDVAAAMGKATQAHCRGIRQVGVHVLQDAAMPGILIEVGFLTNPNEEALLHSEAFQDNLASGMAQGIHHYMSGETGGQAP